MRSINGKLFSKNIAISGFPTKEVNPITSKPIRTVTIMNSNKKGMDTFTRLLNLASLNDCRNKKINAKDRPKAKVRNLPADGI